MLKFKKLFLKNFGPYKGEQTIVFPSEDGVIIIYGENGRGKTSLLNAIRYALFGKVIGRSSREQKLPLVGNWESATEGEYGFKVILTFEYEGHEYDLTRQYAPKASILVPSSNSDFEEETFLRKDGIVLSPDVKNKELARIMPEQISRFFLFDGELLQQYEELLVNESDMGGEIKKAIERILGLPILTNARNDLAELSDRAEKKMNQAAQKNQRTQQIGNLLENSREKLQKYLQNISEFEKEKEELLRNRVAIEEDLKRNEKERTQITKKNFLEEELKKQDEKKQAKEIELKKLLEEGWKGMLNSVIQQKTSEIDVLIKQYEEEQRKKISEQENIRKLHTIVASGKCPTCKQGVGQDVISRVEEEIQASSDLGDMETINSTLASLNSKRMSLLIYKGNDIYEKVKNLEEIVSDYRVEIADKKKEVKEIEDMLKGKGVNEEELKDLQREYANVLKKIDLINDAIKAEKLEREAEEKNIEKLRIELSKISGQDFIKEQKRSKLVQDLTSLLNISIDVYRDNLKNTVEKEASELFLSLTSEPEYGGLKINENYGLSIVHKDGKNIPERSAAVEHVVALALIGALQKSSPLRGPIIMDSPFGRLDGTHKNNITKALPTMSEQVILLVYKDELNQEYARNVLLGKLRAEYEMERKSARHTIIKAVGV